MSSLTSTLPIYQFQPSASLASQTKQHLCRFLVGGGVSPTPGVLQWEPTGRGAVTAARSHGRAAVKLFVCYSLISISLFPPLCRTKRQKSEEEKNPNNPARSPGAAVITDTGKLKEGYQACSVGARRCPQGCTPSCFRNINKYWLCATVLHRAENKFYFLTGCASELSASTCED